MKKVILVNSQILPPSFYPASFKTIPLNLITLASYIKDKYDVRVVDLALCGDFNEMKESIKKEMDEDVLCVGVSVITHSILPAYKISEYIKKNFDVPIIWGGVHPSLMPEQTLKDSPADYVVIGEGEIIFPKLLDTINNSKSLKKINGIGYKENSKIIINKRQKFYNLNKLKNPSYELIDLKRYYRNPGKQLWVLIEFSRGCPYTCSFCYNKPYNKGQYREMSVKKVLERIDYVYNNLKIKDIILADDHLFINIKTATKIFEEIVKRKYKINWWKLSIRIDVALKLKDYHYKLLEKAGVKSIRLGAESGSQHILDKMNKEITVEQIIKVNKKLRKYKISPVYSFIIGFPDETEKEIKQTIDLAIHLIDENPNASIRQIYPLILYPMTDIYLDLQRRRIKIPVKLKDWFFTKKMESYTSRMFKNLTIKMYRSWINKIYRLWMLEKRINLIHNISLYSNNLNMFRLMSNKNNLSSYLFLKLYFKMARFRLKKQFFRFKLDYLIMNKLWK